MEIVDVEIAPAKPAHVTPLELIEDFADVAPNWHYLEEDSRLYETVRGRPACVIRACHFEQKGSLDYAFVGHPHEDSFVLRLVIMCPPEKDLPLTGSGRTASLDRFLKAFTDYLDGRGELVSIRQLSAQEMETVGA